MRNSNSDSNARVYIVSNNGNQKFVLLQREEIGTLNPISWLHNSTGVKTNPNYICNQNEVPLSISLNRSIQTPKDTSGKDAAKADNISCREEKLMSGQDILDAIRKTIGSDKLSGNMDIKEFMYTLGTMRVALPETGKERHTRINDKVKIRISINEYNNGIKEIKTAYIIGDLEVPLRFVLKDSELIFLATVFMKHSGRNLRRNLLHEIIDNNLKRKQLQDRLSDSEREDIEFLERIYNITHRQQKQSFDEWCRYIYIKKRPFDNSVSQCKRNIVTSLEEMSLSTYIDKCAFQTVGRGDGSYFDIPVCMEDISICRTACGGRIIRATNRNSVLHNSYAE